MLVVWLRYTDFYFILNLMFEHFSVYFLYFGMYQRRFLQFMGLALYDKQILSMRVVLTCQ